MFSGIVEAMAQVVRIDCEGTNKHFTLRSPFPTALGIDQSIAHNGVCLTVVKHEGDLYTVTAMQETLRLTNLDELKVGDWVNLEKAMSADKLLDGHIVQGHVDCKAVCTAVEELDGSWKYTFEYPSSQEMIRRGYFCVDKGSVCINGVSLTVCEPQQFTRPAAGSDSAIEEWGAVSVNIIPFTHEVTNFKYIKVGSPVNIEFDIIGKYLARFASLVH